MKPQHSSSLFLLLVRLQTRSPAALVCV